MKKIFWLIAFLFVTVGMFAQVDTPTVSTTTENILSGTWDIMGNFLSQNVWTVIFVVSLIISELLPYVKWTPHNSILQAIWSVFKTLVNFVARNKRTQ